MSSGQTIVLSYWRRPTTPFDDNQGWLVKDNVLEPLWAKGPILPSSLIDILGHVNTEFDEKEEDEEDVDFLELEMTLSDED